LIRFRILFGHRNFEWGWRSVMLLCLQHALTHRGARVLKMWNSFSDGGQEIGRRYCRLSVDLSAMTNRYQILSVGKYVEDQLRLRMLSTLRVSPATATPKLQFSLVYDATIDACRLQDSAALAWQRWTRHGYIRVVQSRYGRKVWRFRRQCNAFGFLLASKNQHHETRRGPTISWISGCRWCLYHARVPSSTFDTLRKLL